MTKKQKKVLIRIIISGVLLGALLLSPVEGVWRALLFLIPYLIIGYDILKKAFKGIIRGQLLDENFLMAVATIGAVAIGEYAEGVLVMLFYQIGELFQSYAVGKSRKNISELMDIRPDRAYVEYIGEAPNCITKDLKEENSGKGIKEEISDKDIKEESFGKDIKQEISCCDNKAANEQIEIREVDPSMVTVGSIIVVKPGEKIPIDGVIIEGTSMLDTSALTGESVPRSAKCGDEVISGCINLSGLLRICTTKDFGESTVSKILNLVENATSKKSRSEQFISKFARVYTPVVCISALIIAVFPPLANILFLSSSPEWKRWLYSALSFLVTSCPCALVISIPLTFFAGIGGAGRKGILIKGSNYLEALSKVKTVVFDKTGTMTKGVFEVVGVHHNEADEEELLHLAALLEENSSHPVARSIVKEYEKRCVENIAVLEKGAVSEIREISGGGVTAVVDISKLTEKQAAVATSLKALYGNKKVRVALGNGKLMKELGIEYKECGSNGTVVHIAVDNSYAGHILISDVIKPTAKEAVGELRNAGIKKCVMLTGDRKSAAQSIAAELKVDEVFSELLPEDKVTKVEELLNAAKRSVSGGKNKKELVAFVGDGINDAPVLTRADVGIAMGALGSDAAIEAADVVLMDDDPLKIAQGIKLARKCIKIVYENIGFAITIKIACLVLITFGLVGMDAAIFADVGVMVLAVLNAIRALRE